MLQSPIAILDAHRTSDMDLNADKSFRGRFGSSSTTTHMSRPLIMCINVFPRAMTWTAFHPSVGMPPSSFVIAKRGKYPGLLGAGHST